jgi:multicomponent Na+:H+ antiporter subunit G
MPSAFPMPVNHFAVLALAALGALLMLISSFGLLRLKGLHQRMQAASIGSSAAITLLLLSAGIYYWDSAEFGRMILLIAFFFVTSPIASTAIARAGYRLQGYRTRRFFTHDDLASPQYIADFMANDRERMSENANGSIQTREQESTE